MFTHKRTLQKFFAAFKPGEMLLPKEIKQRSGLAHNTVFHMLNYGVAQGFLAKQGRRYFVKFPETPGQKQLELPAPWAEIYQLKLQEVAEKNKVSAEELPDWIKELVKGWILHDALWKEKMKLQDLTIRSPRQKLEDKKREYTRSAAPLDNAAQKWKESFDKWILKQIKIKKKTVFS
jgi:hypothetical protein